jgi:hypothetical protein
VDLDHGHTGFRVAREYADPAIVAQMHVVADPHELAVINMGRTADDDVCATCFTPANDLRDAERSGRFSTRPVTDITYEARVTAFGQ